MLYARIFNQSGKQCGSSSDGFVRSQLIWIYTVFEKEYIQVQPVKVNVKWNICVESDQVVHNLSFGCPFGTNTVNHYTSVNILSELKVLSIKCYTCIIPNTCNHISVINAPPTSHRANRNNDLISLKE